MKSLMRLWALLLISFYLGASALPLVAFSSTLSFTARPTSGAAPLIVKFTSPYGYAQGATGQSIVLDFDDGSQPQTVNCSNTQSGKAGICDTPAAIQHTYAAGLYEPIFESISSAPGQPATVLGTTTIAVGSLPACKLHLNTTIIPVGGSITLSWASINATAGAITNVGNVGPSGSINLLPSSAAYTTYAGSFTGPLGTANCSATVQVSAGSGGTGGGGTSGGGTSSGTGGTTVAPTAGASTVTPAAATAQGALVPCGRGIFSSSDTTNDPNNSTGCQACNLAQLIQNIITFAIGLAIPIAAALFAWAGVLYFTSAGDHHKLEQAKAIFKNAFIGFLIAITAWLVINTALNVIFNQGEFAGSSWFTIQCSTTIRPVTGSISTVLTQILGNAQVTDSTLSTSGTGGGTPAPGSAAYTTAQQQTAIDDALVALDDACSGGDNASCTAYQNAQNAGAMTSDATTQLANLCDANDPNSESCVAYGQIIDPTTVTPDASLFTSSGTVTTVTNPQMAAQLAAACAQDSLSSSNCAIAQQIAQNESSGGNNCTTSPTGAAGCMQVLATTACTIQSSISADCSACLSSGNSISAACSPVIQTISSNPQLGTNLGVQYISQLQNTPALQSLESQYGTCQITAAAYYQGPGNVLKAGGVPSNATSYVAKACGS